jgi:hypothetical protein
MLLQNVESYAFSEGQKLLVANYTDKWLERLGDASLKMDETQQERKVICGLPRTRKWIRVKPSTELQIKEVKLMARETGLKCKTQKDGKLL